MTKTTTPTLAELMEQQAAIERQIAATSLAAVQEAKTIVDREALAQAADDLETVMANLPSSGAAYQQLECVKSIIRNVKGWLPGEISRLAALAGEAAQMEIIQHSPLMS